MLPTNSRANTYRYGSRAVLVGHCIYLLGENYPYPSGRVGDVLDLNRKEWRKMESSVTGVEGSFTLLMHSINLVDDRICIYGASNENLGLNDIFALDLTTEDITLIPTFGNRPAFSWEHTADFYEEGRRLLFYGGASRQAPTQLFDTLRVLDVDRMRWEHIQVKGEKPPAMFRHSSCIAHKTLFIIGGIVQGAGRLERANCSNFFLIRLDKCHPFYVWEHVEAQGSSPGVRNAASLVALGGGKLLQFGGSEAGQGRNSLHILENCHSHKRQWHELTFSSANYKISGVLPESREAAPMIITSTKVILFGGSFTAVARPGHYELVQHKEPVTS